MFDATATARAFEGRNLLFKSSPVAERSLRRTLLSRAQSENGHTFQKSKGLTMARSLLTR